jgi:hypothetical protein
MTWVALIFITIVPNWARTPEAAETPIAISLSTTPGFVSESSCQEFGFAAARKLKADAYPGNTAHTQMVVQVFCVQKSP